MTERLIEATEGKVGEEQRKFKMGRDCMNQILVIILVVECDAGKIDTINYP